MGVMHHRNNPHHYHWLWRTGRSSVELYDVLRSKPLATGRPTSNSIGKGRSRPQPQRAGRGEPTPQGTTGGEGGIPLGGGGRAGPSSAAPYILYFWLILFVKGAPVNPRAIHSRAQ